MKTPTGSKLNLAEECAGAFALPWVSETSKYAESGKELHETLEGGEIPEGFSLNGFPPLSSGAPEVTFAIDLQSGTAREVGRRLKRKYPPVGQHEILLTADWVGLTESSVFVADFKSGREGLPAVSDRQLQAGAFAAARAYRRTTAIVAKVYLREGQDPWIDTGELDPWQLDDVLADLRTIIHRVRAAQAVADAGGTPDVSAGEHCRFCPSIASCPKTVAVVRWSADLAAKNGTPTLTPQNIGEFYKFLRHLDSATKTAWSLLREWAFGQGGIDLGDGVWFGPVAGSERIADHEAAIALLRQRLGPEAAETVIQRVEKTSKGAIEKAIGKKSAAPIFKEMRSMEVLKKGIECKEFRVKDAKKTEAA